MGVRWRSNNLYRVEVDWAPAYELVASVKTLIDPALRRDTELGKSWVAGARRLVPEGFVATVAGMPDLNPWIRRCPGKRDADGFLDWVGGQVPRDPWLAALRNWNEVYFRSLDPAICAGLAAEADGQRRRDLPPQEQVESATAGLWLDPGVPFDCVILVPQYHARPYNLHASEGGVLWIKYPADVLPPPPGEPPPALARTLHALADGSRLRILRFVAGGTRSFTEVVRESGLAKSTVHHHLVALRSAGLVRVHVSGERPDRYSLRPGALETVGTRVAAYARGDDR